MKIVIIDYGMGNINSIVSAFKYLGVENISISNEANEIKNADKLILPGVGSFSEAMKNIKNLNLDSILKDVVINDKKPILGICLGMQLLLNFSEEDEPTDGLKFIDAECKKFNVKNLKIPHVGFNQIRVNSKSILFNGIDDNSDFYFTHSFRVNTNTDICQSLCTYGEEFVVAYESNNIVGVQFHPELSQNNGLNLLKNFLEKF